MATLSTYMSEAGNRRLPEEAVEKTKHVVIDTPAADRFPPGAEVYAMPTHICPTCAMHRQAYVVENGRVIERWDIVARDRVLTI